MSFKVLIPLTLAMTSGAALAQADADSTKSAEQITCEMTRDCADTATQTQQPLRKVGQQRGFSLQRKQADKATGTRQRMITQRDQKAATTPGVGKANPKLAATKATPTPAAKATAGAARLSVGFVTGSATLDAAGKRQADQLIAALKGPRLAGKKVIVSGHTDSVGDRAYNLDLSRRRAQALVDLLAANGVDRALLEARGYGFDQPLPGMSPAAARNRRVEVALAD